MMKFQSSLFTVTQANKHNFCHVKQLFFKLLESMQHLYAKMFWLRDCSYFCTLTMNLCKALAHNVVSQLASQIYVLAGWGAQLAWLVNQLKLQIQLAQLNLMAFKGRRSCSMSYGNTTSCVGTGSRGEIRHTFIDVSKTLIATLLLREPSQPAT